MVSLQSGLEQGMNNADVRTQRDQQNAAKRPFQPSQNRTSMEIFNLRSQARSVNILVC